MPSIDFTSGGGGPHYVGRANGQVSCSVGDEAGCKLLNGVKYSLAGYDLLSEIKIGLKLMQLGASACGNEEDDYTHLICDNLSYDDEECVQARKKGKKIVNSLWLDHLLKFGHLVNDDKVVYQPPKDLNAIKGANDVRICSSGYTEYEKEVHQAMAKLIGAEYSWSFKSGWATHLICSRLEGYKYERAKEQNMRIANHLWLEESIKEWKLLPVGDYTKVTVMRNPFHDLHSFFMCPFDHDSGMGLEEYVLDNYLIKIVAPPGLRGQQLESTEENTNLILQRSAAMFYGLHLKGHSLDGKFNLGNLCLDDQLQMKLRMVDPALLKDYDELRGMSDWKQFECCIKNDFFSREKIPDQISRWLSRICKNPVKDKELVLNYSAIQDSLGKLALLWRMYNRFLVLDLIDSKALKEVLGKLKKYSGWQKKGLSNRYLRDTFLRVDPRTKLRTLYEDDIYGLLRLIRNTLQHLLPKNVWTDGTLTFADGDYVYIVLSEYPDLLCDLQEALFDEGHFDF